MEFETTNVKGEGKKVKWDPGKPVHSATVADLHRLPSALPDYCHTTMGRSRTLRPPVFRERLQVIA